jgi:thioredoxin 1
MGKVINVTDDDFAVQVEGSKGLTLVDFWASWCGPCRMMGPVYEKAAEKFNNIKFCKMSTEENEATPTEANITGIPCIIVYKDGKEIDRIIGYRDQKEFESVLSKLK